MADEKTLQEEFYEKLREYDGTLARIDNWTDGVIRGTIIENKLKIDNPNTPLAQAITYLSRFRNIARDVPGHIMTIDLTQKYIRIYNSNDFLSEIETPHYISASKSNKSFITDIKPIKEYGYNENIKEVCEDLKYNDFLKVHIDFYNIVANSQRFYTENTSQTKKLAFRKELLNPKILNIYPISEQELKEKETTEFAGVIDCLNDKLLQKELGAFYTPLPYVKLSTEMVREAIKRITKANPNNDYIILDRCAGTGNLEQFFTDQDVKDILLSDLEKYISHDLYISYLKDKKDYIEMLGKTSDEICVGDLEKYKTNISMFEYIFDNELSHCILSTYETWEWTVLNAKYSDKVRLIIPPEGTIDKRNSLVLGADALSEAFITGNEELNIFGNNETNEAYLKAVRQLNSYVANKNCNIILYENPPYSDEQADYICQGTVRNNLNYVRYQYLSDRISDRASFKDLSNLFIWSGYKYYLTKENDFFVLYSPIKYWKSLGLSDKKMIDGYLFNRAYFHASPSAISCILWQNIPQHDESLELKVIDIENEQIKPIYKDNIGKIQKVNFSFADKYYDNRKFETDEYFGVCCESNGYEAQKKKWRIKSKTNFNIVAFLRTGSFAIDAKNVALLRIPYYTYKGGFYLRTDNFEKKLPLFCAKLYPQENWYERDVYFTTADRGSEYESDTEFLKKCLIYTCLTNRNYCISFIGSDKRFYRNELCLLQNTVSDSKLKEFQLDEKDKRVIKEWNDVLIVAHETQEYKNLLSQMPNITLGLHQIEEEIDVFEYLGKTYSKTEKKELVKNLSEKEKLLIHHKYPDLVKEIDELKQVLKGYYATEIQDKLFLYELLK